MRNTSPEISIAGFFILRKWGLREGEGGKS